MDGLLPVPAPTKGNARGSGYERNEHDWYVEPPWFVEQLLDAEDFTGDIWDPCCGLGTIPLVCRDRGLDAVGSDISDRGYSDHISDFFRARQSRADTIISNPPFKRSVQFVHHALSLGVRRLAIVADIGYLAGVEHRELFLNTPLMRVWIASSRVPMPPGQIIAEALPVGLSDSALLDALRKAHLRPGVGGTAMKFIWLVWDRAWDRDTIAGWLPPYSKRASRGEKLL